MLKYQAECPKIKRLRSTDTINWKQCCFVCGNLALPDPKHRDCKAVIQVRTKKLKQCTLKVCEGRKDKWTLDVKSCLICCVDLVASDSIKLFLTNRESNLNETEKPGRKENSTMAENFERICEWFESQMVPVTTSELHNKMEELANSEEIY
ncbi:uncharacterized protein LOC136087390 isoform X2 [Hydra vulgaris]|uniref:Uncharacterized protein LOC136087390 isoform X2 n=1 Tax=Hydra vulgaris TaxID=6087 RepID=A0ABM4CVZ6_HYDVU